MDMRRLIATKRDGRKHTEEELRFIALGAARGEIPDYQLSAWLMAAYLNPLDEQETAWLTRAMAESGERIDLTGLPKPWVDKHSTGGVGDKTTIVLLPLLAACGLTVVKMSGRGLGITGGTVDKLASVPGFRLDLSPKEMKEQATRIGVAWTGQSPDLAPADKALYALRDATATVESIPLIASSILSKKIAGGAETVVFDVKCGSGAFMRTRAEAVRLMQALESIGSLAGLKVRAAVTDMDQPLGSAVGNSLEVREAIGVLRNEDLPEPVQRFRELCLYFAALTLEASGKASSADSRNLAEDALGSGAAMRKASEWFEAQGSMGDFDELLLALPIAPAQLAVESQGTGWVSRVDARTIGEVVIALGGGRRAKEDVIDHAVGVEVLVQVGQQVRQGDPCFKLHAGSEAAAHDAGTRLAAALEVSDSFVAMPPIVLPTR